MDETSAQCQNDAEVRWYVMRDLKRANALYPAYKMLQDMGIEVYTPLKWQLTVRQGRKVRKQVPVMQDLLFVHDKRSNIDPRVRKTPTLQYRFLRNRYCEPMVVREREMERFIHAINNSDSVRYYRADEISSDMHGRQIRIVGGPLDGYEGKLVTVRGSKVRRLMVVLPDLLTAAVEVSPDYIQLI